jgi:Uncharacterized protein with SCP/PR1 domains
MTRRTLVAVCLAPAALVAMAVVPVSAQEKKPADVMAAGRGEIRVRGVIRTAEQGGAKLILDALSVTGPDGKTQTFPAPRPKVVAVTTKTLLRSGDPQRPGTLSELRTGRAVIVVGRNDGPGTALPARIVLIGAPVSTPEQKDRARVTVGNGPPAPVAPSGDGGAAPDLPGPTEAAEAILRSINLHRREAGLPELTLNARLSAAAQAHSEWMARERRLEHRGRGNTDPGERIEQAGYRWAVYAENLAQGAATPDEAVGMWLRSPGHRRNLLKADVTQIGVGKAGRYWTLLLAAPL